MAMTDLSDDAWRATDERLRQAVQRNRVWSLRGLQERMFTLAFRGLVYAQIWEDPVVDMDALAIRPDDHIVAIASGGCNVMSYLTAGPAKVTAVDLNGTHIALNKLKVAAAKHLPDYAAFRQFFGHAADPRNVALYNEFLKPHLDATTRAYWEGRDGLGRRRISYFASGFYRQGLLGRFIGAGHLIARLHGRNPARMLEAASPADQARLFDEVLRPLFDAPLIRWLTRRPSSLYGLGIPPAQYDALLTSSGRGNMAEVLLERLRRLACDYDFKDNYYAWQAFGRGYGQHDEAPLPPYLQAGNFEAVRANADRVDVRHANFIEFLRGQPDESADCYILLDAQDWMSDEMLTALWREMTRTARPGARVIFRTAGDDSPLAGRVPAAILSYWQYNANEGRAHLARDRSAIYGGFHIYRFDDARGL